MKNANFFLNFSLKKLPARLILSRFFLGLFIPILAWKHPPNYTIWIAIILILALVTDIFDGIIARKWDVTTEKLRVWDSNVDQFFWLVAICTIFYLNKDLVKPLFTPIAIIICLEVLAYFTSFIKFKKTVATHSYLAKFWTISLLAFLLEILLFSSTSSFVFCFWLGLVSRVEIILILLKLKKWTADVPSLLQLINMKKGKR